MPRTETITKDEFDVMRKIGLIDDAGKLTADGKANVFGDGIADDVTYTVGDIIAAGTAVCKACGQLLLPQNMNVADGCPCNSARGVNHGIVPAKTCTCIICDPAQTGAPRP